MKSSRRKKPALRDRSSRAIEILRTTPTNTVCPNFFVLSHANGCSFSPQCSYCYLKSSFWYLKDDVAFANTDDLERQVVRWIRGDGYECYVLNTGNLSDSLAFEDVRPLMARLVELFRRESEARDRPHTLLLVTKGGTEEAAELFEIEPCSRVIVSFSINTPEAARDHERGAAPPADRLAAARRLKKQGWRVRIRIDPMILGYDYRDLAESIGKLRPERVTLGSLRAGRDLLRRIGNGIFKALERPDDPKAIARYPRDKRIALYRSAVEPLRDVCSIGLCEETPDVWRELGLDVEGKTCNCNV